MRTFISIPVLTLALVACGSSDDATTTSTAITLEPTTTSMSPSSGTASTAGATASTEGLERADESAEPSYDVYLAAVAEAVSETRFADVPFEQPELTVATGLALCDTIVADEDTGPAMADFLAELAGGDPSTADEDQLILAGALLGAAEAALCADWK